MQTLWQDLRYGLRMLRKSPGFTLVAAVTLALGIGANTAIFSLIDAALLRSLPVRDPQGLVVFQWTAHNSPNLKGHYSYMSCPAAHEGAAGEHGCWFSYQMFQQFQSAHEAFWTVAALCGNVGLSLRGNGPATFVQGEMVSGNFFDALGVGAAVGRTFGSSDDTPGATPVVVLSYGYWQSAFGGDPAAVGKTVWLNNVPVTIVGVAAEGFPSLDPGRVQSLWLPLSASPQIGLDLFGNVSGDHPSLRSGDDIWWVYVVARLKEGMSIGQAQAAAGALFHNDALDPSRKFFKTEDALRLVLMPAAQAIGGLREQFSTSLAILMTAVGMVLVVACANVAGLMLARSSTRQKEFAVRLALGARRAKIVRQLLTESMLLSLASGASGILLAYWSVQSLVAFMSRGRLWPSHLEVHLDLRILMFTLMASTLTGLFFGLAPAFRGTKLDLTPALKESVPALAGGSRRRWLNLGSGLVITQVALAKEYDQRIARMAKQVYPETALLKQVKGVGDLIATAYVLTIEDPQRFRKSRDAGCFVGLQPGRRNSGESEPQMHISKEGDEYLRTLLVQGAHYILGPFGADSDLRRWGQKLSVRGGKNAKKRAVVAVARKLAVLLHRLWVSGEVYEPLRNSQKAMSAAA